MNRLKFKILIAAGFIIIGVASIVTSYNILHDQNENDRRMVDAYESVRRIYTETLRDTVQFYSARGEANLRSPGILEAVRAKDHEKLYELMRPRWEVMRHENPGLTVLQFHNGDGTSLLRVHQPGVHGDPIALQRSMVAHIHKHHTLVYGFEEGRQGLAFRILVPILDHGKYIGAVEFGIRAPYFTEKIYRLTEYDSFFLVHNSVLGMFGRIDNLLKVGEYALIDVSPKLLPLMEYFSLLHDSPVNDIISFQGNSYAMSTVSIDNFRGDHIGSLMFVREVDNFWDHIGEMVIASIVIVFFLMMIIGLIIHRVYDTIASKIQFQELYSQTILDSIPSPVIVTDGHDLIAANHTFLAYLEYVSIEAFKKEHQCVCEYFEEGDTDEYLLSMRDDQRWTEYIIDHPLINHKAKITLKDSTTIFEVKLSVLKFNEESRYVVIFNDISQIQSRSLSDPLTGVANRLHFTMVYEHAFNVLQRDQKSLGIIFLDIDHFKKVNDTYGHITGDTVLKQIAALVRRRIRKSDIIARWGGEEFILLLPNTTLEEAIQVAQILKNAVVEEKFDTVGNLTCSFGVAVSQENESREDLLKRADERLYEAKNSGRNKVVY